MKSALIILAIIVALIITADTIYNSVKKEKCEITQGAKSLGITSCEQLEKAQAANEKDFGKELKGK